MTRYALSLARGLGWVLVIVVLLAIWSGFDLMALAE